MFIKQEYHTILVIGVELHINEYIHKIITSVLFCDAGHNYL